MNLDNIDWRVKLTLLRIHELWASPFRFELLAKEVNLSYSRLSHLFRIDLGISIREYLREKRLAEATDLLQASVLSIKEISYQTGFNNVSNFNHMFKRKFGVTPSAYRIQTKSIQLPQPDSIMRQLPKPGGNI